MRLTIEEKQEMLLVDLRKRYSASQRALANLSPTTIYNYGSKVKSFCEWAGDKATLADLTRALMLKYFEDLNTRLPKSSRAAKTSLLHFNAWLIKQGLLTENLLDGIEMPRVKQTAREPVSDENITKMFEACDRLPQSAYKQALSRAVLAILVYTGLRRSETVDLRTGDIDLKDGCVRVWGGKGNKNREVYFSQEFVPHIKAYLKLRSKNSGSDKLLLYEKGAPVGSDGVYGILERLKKVAGLAQVPVSPHRIRHSYASRKVANNTPLSVLQMDMGHSHLKTTAGYIHANKGMQRQFADAGGLNVGKEAENAKKKPAVGVSGQQRVRRIVVRGAR